MQLLVPLCEMNDLLPITDKLVGIGSLTDYDGIFLKKKMAKFCIKLRIL